MAKHDLDWNAIIDLAHEVTEKQGVTVSRGKKYSTVATRVELFRRHFPGWGIETEVLKAGAAKGDPCIVRAIVTDDAGAIKATGHACEIVGNGNVNATSALENAETSAMGRALACLGLHGGEFASVNEIDGVDRKRETQTEDPATNADIRDPAPEPAKPDRDAETRTLIDGAVSLDGLETARGRIREIWSGKVPRWVGVAFDTRKAEIIATLEKDMAE